MPDEVLTPRDDGDLRPVAGFFGKLPSTGDFVWRGLPDAFRKHWDFWLTSHLAPFQRHGHAFPPGGLRFRLPSGGHLAAGVILPSGDSVGRLFPLSLLMIAEGDLTCEQVDSWCDAALTVQPETLASDELWLALDSLPAPSPDGPATGMMQLWARGGKSLVIDPTDPSPAIQTLFGR